MKPGEWIGFLVFEGIEFDASETLYIDLIEDEIDSEVLDHVAQQIKDPLASAFFRISGPLEEAVNPV